MIAIRALPTVTLMKGETFAIYVDVDGTLLLWPGKVPPRNSHDYRNAPVNKPLVLAIKEWHRGRNVLVLWSRGGKEHCEFAAKRCGLKPDACIPKPRICVDDALQTITAGNAKRGFIVIDHNYFG